MSLALMTTAYGAGLASLIFTPLAGRLEHHNHIFLECHKQILSKIGILIQRDDRSMDSVRETVAS
jgi:chemotaxis protein MotA